MIEKVIKALTEKDCTALVSCFSENCVYIDYSPSLCGEPSSFLYGSDSLEMFFKVKFASDGLEVAEPLIENEKSATYFTAYGGPYIFCRLNIEEYDSSGLIKRIVVHPA